MVNWKSGILFLSEGFLDTTIPVSKANFVQMRFCLNSCKNEHPA